MLGRVDGRVQRVRVQQVPSHDILVCPELLTFEISRKGSRVGVGEDIMQLRQNVSGIDPGFMPTGGPQIAEDRPKDGRQTISREVG